MALMRVTVYTILKSGDLDAAFKAGRQIEFAEGKRWVGAASLLEEAKRLGWTLPIVFAPGERTRELVYHGRVVNLVVRAEPDENGNCSYITVADLTPFKAPRPRKTDLVVESTKRPIPQGHIRPYVLCRTPTFLK